MSLSSLLFLPLCLSASLSLCLSASLPLCLSASLPLCLSASLPLCLSASLPLCLSVLPAFPPFSPSCLSEGLPPDQGCGPTPEVAVLSRLEEKRREKRRRET